MIKCEEDGDMDMDTTQTKTETHRHNVIFCYKKDNYEVTCNAPKTVHEMLKTDSTFNSLYDKNRGKELVILRTQGRATVKPDFPCSLLKPDERLEITFSNSDVKSTIVETKHLPANTPENLISFYINTTCGKNTYKLMINKPQKVIFNYVCVYAVKGENVEAALKRDGRFNDVIYTKCALRHEETNNICNVSTLVDDLHEKKFMVQASSHQTSSQKPSKVMSQKSETVMDETSEVPETPQENKPNQDRTNSQEKETAESINYPNINKIQNTEEILNLLRKQYAELLNTLLKRHNLKNNVALKRFFREEYDKSVQNFKEVKILKKLMERSDSVCLICIDEAPKGTGFLLFDRFILTNAHVYDILPEKTPKSKLSVLFRYEDICGKEKAIPMKDCVAYAKGKDTMGNFLDFALLELEKEPSDLKYPGLLKYYSASPSRGGVCIIGHPGCGFKQIDPCFIIPKEEIQQKAERYFKENPTFEVIQVITQQLLNEDWEKRKSQLIYDSCFFHGSSGSPVFDERGNLIGVHTGGYVYMEGNKLKSVLEYGLMMFPILMHIFIQCTQSKRDDVIQYFESENFKHVRQEANKHIAPEY